MEIAFAVQLSFVKKCCGQILEMWLWENVPKPFPIYKDDTSMRFDVVVTYI